MNRYIIIKHKDGIETAYSTGEHGEHIINAVKIQVELHNRDNKDDEQTYYESEVWPPVEIGLDEYKAQASAVVSRRSYAERSAILDDQTISNISIGATSGYPAYLTPANVAAMIEKFKVISKKAKADIQAAATKADVDLILKNLRFPTATEIMAQY